MTNKEFLTFLKANEFESSTAWWNGCGPSVTDEDTIYLSQLSALLKVIPNTSPAYKSMWDVYNTEKARLEQLAKENSPLGKYESVLREGGSEGCGEHVEHVVYFEKFNKYVRATAYYQSYTGIDDWGDWDVVLPEQVMQTIYVTDVNG